MEEVMGDRLTLALQDLTDIYDDQETACNSEYRAPDTHKAYRFGTFIEFHR